MAEFEINIPQGELTIQPKKMHGALNALVLIFAFPEEWCYKQFPTMELLERFALDNNLTIKREE